MDSFDAPSKLSSVALQMLSLEVALRLKVEDALPRLEALLDHERFVSQALAAPRSGRSRASSASRGRANSVVKPYSVEGLRMVPANWQHVRGFRESKKGLLQKHGEPQQRCGQQLLEDEAAGGDVHAVWDSSASSVETVEEPTPAADGAPAHGISWTAATANCWYMIGLSRQHQEQQRFTEQQKLDVERHAIEACKGMGSSTVGHGMGAIDFALSCNVQAKLSVWEDGQRIGTFGKYEIGDRLAVRVHRRKVGNNKSKEGTGYVVSYFCNHQLLYTSKEAPSFPLVADCSFQSPGGRAEEVYMEEVCPEVCSTGVSDVDDADGGGADDVPFESEIQLPLATPRDFLATPRGSSEGSDIRLSEMAFGAREDAHMENGYDSEEEEEAEIEAAEIEAEEAEAKAAAGEGLFVHAMGTRALQVALSLDGGGPLERIRICMVGDTAALKQHQLKGMMAKEKQQQRRTHARRVSGIVAPGSR
jgi:hypothetical protein